MLLCGLISLFVFASSYETTFNYDLPVVDGVTTVRLQPLQRILTAAQAGQADVGNYGKPQQLKLPSSNVRLVLAPAISRHGTWLARANTAHYSLLTPSHNGTIGNTFLYFRKSWRTDNEPEKLAQGDNIFLDTDRDWRYFYRVDNVKAMREADLYVMRDTPASQLVLAAVDPGRDTVYVAQASLVNVQSVRQ
jgi:hypothetical protein